jgi:hypothetical protein
LQRYDAVCVDQVFNGALSTDEVTALNYFVWDGGRLVLIGENGAWAQWPSGASAESAELCTADSLAEHEKRFVRRLMPGNIDISFLVLSGNFTANLFRTVTVGFYQ